MPGTAHQREYPDQHPPPSRLHPWDGVAVIGDACACRSRRRRCPTRTLACLGASCFESLAFTDALPPDQVCASVAEFVEALLDRRKTISWHTHTERTHRIGCNMQDVVTSRTRSISPYRINKGKRETVLQCLYINAPSTIASALPSKDFSLDMEPIDIMELA